jgi:hypothetical protein
MRIVKVEDMTTAESSSHVQVTIEVYWNDLPSDTGRKLTEQQFKDQIYGHVTRAMRILE